MCVSKFSLEGRSLLAQDRWQSAWGSDWRAWVAFVVLFVLLIPVFLVNAAGTAKPETFHSWERSSESLVLAKIESDRTSRAVDSYGLLRAQPDWNSPYSTIDSPTVGSDGAKDYRSYLSQLGLTGYLYSALYQYTPCSSLTCLHLVSSVLFSLLLVFLVFLLGLITRRSFAVAFLLSMVASPWIVTMGRNLYWSPWLWLLPVCAAALFVLARKRSRRIAALALVFGAFILRFASGYEFITSMSLMAVAVPVLAFIFQDDFSRGPLIRAAKDALGVFAASLAAFVAVLLVHTSARGAGSISEGIRLVWQGDVLRRTYGSAEDFTDAYSASLNAGPLSILRKYLFEWKTDFMTIGSGAPFSISFGPLSLWILISICLLIVAFRFAAHDRLWVRDLALLVVTALIPVSWYVLGKSHSYIHTHINFVLWYLFFAGALIFVVYDYLVTRGLTVRIADSLRLGSRVHGTK